MGKFEGEKKLFFILSCAKGWHTAKPSICRVPALGTRQSGGFAVCLTASHGKVGWRRAAVSVGVGRRMLRPLRRVLAFGTRQRCLFAVCLRHGTQQSLVSPCAKSSPYVLCMAHGKAAFRRVPVYLHTAKKEAHGELPVSGSARTSFRRRTPRCRVALPPAAPAAAAASFKRRTRRPHCRLPRLPPLNTVAFVLRHLQRRPLLQLQLRLQLWTLRRWRTSSTPTPSAQETTGQSAS